MEIRESAVVNGGSVDKCGASKNPYISRGYENRFSGFGADIAITSYQYLHASYHAF